MTEAEKERAEGLAVAGLDEILAYLDVRPTEDGFEGEAAPWFEGDYLFGGFVVGQALAVAAKGAAAPLRVHSMHGYFLRPVAASIPVSYTVTEVKSGRAFATRRLCASQSGKPVFEMLYSITGDADGYLYDLPSAAPFPALDPTAAEPGLPPWEVCRIGPTEARADGTRESTHRHWFRVDSLLPDDRVLHLGLLGVATDWTGVGGRPLNLVEDTTGMVSLDHAVWFHRPVRADEWLSYDVQALVNAGGRGTLRGVMRDESGRVCVSVAQEMLLAVL
ncbi:MAG TPA: acyl-CoA thioesterase domain-containing protein [Acidimicrobiales bacterium]|nr:acyl-CoA thioesterase domain-containing protein [Acidimicrobiales bacterium]